MTNIIHFPTSDKNEEIDGRPLALAVAFSHPDELRKILRNVVSREVADAAVPLRVCCAVARQLLDPGVTDEKAKIQGWADAAACRQRGLDILDVIAALR